MKSMIIIIKINKKIVWKINDIIFKFFYYYETNLPSLWTLFMVLANLLNYNWFAIKYPVLVET